RQRPVEESEVRTGRAGGVGIEEVVRADVVLVHAALDEPHTEHACIEQVIFGDLRGDRRYVMESRKLHVIAFVECRHRLWVQDCRRGVARSHARGGTGNTSVNVEPLPCWLRTVRSPPIPRARSRLIARPRPVPSCDDDSERPTCTNGSKIDSRWFLGIPMPVSVTSIRTVSDDRASHDSRIEPFSGVNLIAF